jgi:hypothetical protein
MMAQGLNRSMRHFCLWKGVSVGSGGSGRLLREAKQSAEKLNLAIASKLQALKRCSI